MMGRCGGALLRYGSAASLSIMVVIAYLLTHRCVYLFVSCIKVLSIYSLEIVVIRTYALHCLLKTVCMCCLLLSDLMYVLILCCISSHTYSMML